MGEISLIDGPLPIVVLAIGGLAMLYLLVRRGRPAVVAVVVAIVVAVLVLLGLNWLVIGVLDLFPDDLPQVVRMWIGVAAGTVVLIVGSFVGTRAGRKVLAVGCGLLVLLAVGSQVNAYYEQYPTLGALAGADTAGVTAFPGADPGLKSRPESTPVVARWSGPATGQSRVETVRIPGTASGFTGRDAYLYLPAAYSSANPPLLPVLILVSGQPGGPEGWVASGRLQSLLDQFADGHQGLAPVTVVVDPNGSGDGNSMCMDSDVARADTYLARDVPEWIIANVGVDSNHAHWAFGGWSFGGTCAVQMATTHPDLYPSFIDVAGEREPAISADRAETVRIAFHGDTSAFHERTPLALLAKHKYPNVWGYFAAGGNEPQVQDWMNELAAAARKAGMTVQTHVVPGEGHSWGVPHGSLVPALTWLGARLGLSR